MPTTLALDMYCSLFFCICCQTLSCSDFTTCAFLLPSRLSLYQYVKESNKKGLDDFNHKQS
jgi:hypothetical protein